MTALRLRLRAAIRSHWQAWLASLALAAFAASAQEITFYYPVAVGGPITKIVDQMAADFEKENPGIKVKPQEQQGSPSAAAAGPQVRNETQ